MFLSYTAPSGSPGWADLKVTTPIGTSTLPRSFFFAQSVNDYSAVQIRGSGFQSGTTATLGGKTASLTLIDSETLTLTIPPASAGLQDLVLTNPDGTKYTLENAVTVQ